MATRRKRNKIAWVYLAVELAWLVDSCELGLYVAMAVVPMDTTRLYLQQVASAQTKRTQICNILALP